MDPAAALQPARSAADRLGELSARLQLRGRAVPLVLQSEAAECGLACLAMVTGHHGHRIDLASLRRRFPPSLRGVTLHGLMATSAALQLSGRALRLELRQLRALRAPCILHWDLAHFVVLVRVRGDRAVIHDPALGRRVYRLQEISRHFTGVALELTPTAEFAPREETRRVRVRDLWTRVQGLAGSLAAVFVLSAFLQLFLLASAFYTQFAVDQGIARSDGDLLGVLALGFGVVLLFQTAVALVRDYTVLYAGQLLSFQMGANLVSHLIRLPLAYFEKRHLGDVLSRVRSLQPIQELLTTGFVSAILDGLLAGLVLALMVAYSARLAALCALTSALFAALRVGLYRPLRQIREEGLIAAAREETLTIEMLRGIQTVKLLGAEPSREALWQNRRADAINANVRAARWELGFSAARSLLFGAENLLVIYWAAQLVLEQRLSVGMLYAFLAYKAQFSDRIQALIDWGMRYRMLEVHLTRLADIVHCREEPGRRAPSAEGRRVQGRIELRDVSFRYSESDPYILRGVSLAVEPGSCIGIVGGSGSGKTTLLKLILGLLEPTEGEIRVDGQRLGPDNLGAYRESLGSVMQEDHFFEGTIAENISGFDPGEDLQRVEQAARAAFIHGDVAALPMGYRSWIGNMGANLSGGQRQRILLARAFYRQPSVLVLDEGTANLDAVLLAAVVRSIARTPITRIVATHQDAVLPVAQQVFEVEGGRVTPRRAPGAATPLARRASLDRLPLPG